jgi:hypothetical protein
MSRRRGGLIGKKVTPGGVAADDAASGMWNLNDVVDAEASGIYPQPDTDPDISSITHEDSSSSSMGTWDKATNNDITWAGVTGSGPFDYVATDIQGDSGNYLTQSGGVDNADLRFIVGNVAVDENVTFKIQVTDKFGNVSTTGNYSVTLNAVEVDISGITHEASSSSSLGEMRKDTSYAITWAGVTGSAPFDYTIVDISGTSNLTQSGGVDGADLNFIIGSVSSDHTATFKIQVTDAYGLTATTGNYTADLTIGTVTLDLRLWGGRGGGSSYSPGYGGYMQWVGVATVGDVLTIYAGNQGTYASNTDRGGGGGGGGSAVLQGSTVIAVAGGGGGAGKATGGGGGYSSGQTGGNGGGGNGGVGGSQGGPGAGGSGGRRTGNAGSGQNGGNSVGAQDNGHYAGGWGYGTGGYGLLDNGDSGSGAGGGGYYGAGSGGGGSGGASGGGGSSYYRTSSLPTDWSYSSNSNTTNNRDGVGYVEIRTEGTLRTTKNYTGSTQTYTIA